MASGQAGHFTTQQAFEAGFSVPLLAKYLKNGKVIRIRRGVYRLIHFPAGAYEDLVSLWLWSHQEGVFSHETALFLHRLSDVLPWAWHLTLPKAWRKRRLRVPQGLHLYYGDIHQEECCWVETLPVTTPRRTLVDCAMAYFAPDLLLQAMHQAVERQLVIKEELQEVQSFLDPYDKDV